MNKFLSNLKDSFIPALFIFIGFFIFNITLEPIISNPLFKLIIVFFIVYTASTLGTILTKKINKRREEKINNNRKL